MGAPGVHNVFAHPWDNIYCLQPPSAAVVVHRQQGVPRKGTDTTSRPHRIHVVLPVEADINVGSRVIRHG